MVTEVSELVTIALVLKLVRKVRDALELISKVLNIIDSYSLS